MKFTTASVTLASILANITSIINEGITWIGSVVSMITENSLLMLFVLFGFIGAGIGLVKRILRL